MSLLRRRVRAALMVAVILAVFLFLGRALWTNWRQIPFQEIRFDPILVALSFLCLVIYFLVCAFAWKQLLRICGGSLGFVRSFQILAMSQLGKYVPGKVWFALGRMYLARRSGVPERVSVVTMTLETMFLLITGGIIGALTVASSWTESLGSRIMVALCVLSSGFVVLHPRIFGRSVDWVMRKLKRETMRVNLTYSGILILVVIYCLCWFWPGLGLFLLVKSFYDVQVIGWPVFVGVFAVAWLAGFVSLLTPSGLGVREGIMSSLLAPYMPIPVAILVALLARVWFTLAELVFFLVSASTAKTWVPVTSKDRET